MTTQDLVAMMDKKYSGDGAVACPREGVQVTMKCGMSTDVHGKLTVHGSGAFLICGVCGAQHPTARI